jgi:hypothetical protein
MIDFRFVKFLRLLGKSKKGKGTVDMKVYIHATHLFLIALLIALFASYSYGANPAMATKEVGEKNVVRIKQKLKEPFLTLLASSEFASFKELERRIEDALTALNSFKKEVQEDVVMSTGATPEPVIPTPVVPPTIPTPSVPAPFAPPALPTPPVPAPTPIAAPPALPAMPAVPEVPTLPEPEEPVAPITPEPETAATPPAPPTPLPQLPPLPTLPPAGAPAAGDAQLAPPPLPPLPTPATPSAAAPTAPPPLPPLPTPVG